MKESDIRKYAGLMQELGLTGLEITDDKKVVRLERNITAPNRTEQIINVESNATAPHPVSDDYISVKSPIVGVFYAAPTENAEPFVSVGDHVDK